MDSSLTGNSSSTTASSGSARSRTGKIARLPQAIRQRLNERLADGEPHQILVAWLNEHAVVRERLDRFHGGRPITEQNLSDWKAGGFRDWERHQETRGMLREFLSESEELSAELGEEELLERATTSVAFVLMRLFNEALATESGPEQRQAVLQIGRELNRMRRVSHERQRVQLLVERAHRPSNEPPEHPMSWAEMNQRIADEDKAMKEREAWLRAEGEALRAEYVAGMEGRALTPERREYIETFFDRYAADLPDVGVESLPGWEEDEEEKPRTRKKRSAGKQPQARTKSGKVDSSAAAREGSPNGGSTAPEAEPEATGGPE